MSGLTWSILVPTLYSRRALMERMLGRLMPQVDPDRVEVVQLVDAGERPIGAKRQRLLEDALGEYVSFIDDDDLVSPDYCGLILAAIDADHPDVIGFRLRFFYDGELSGLAVHSYDAAQMATPGMPPGGKRFNRAPNHLNPVRRTLALQAGGFPPWNHGEDGDFAKRLAALDPRERFIDVALYDYLFRSNRNGEQTNEKRTGKRQ